MDVINTLLSEAQSSLNNVRAEIKKYTQKITNTRTIKVKLEDIICQYEEERTKLLGKIDQAEDEAYYLRHRTKILPQFCEEMRESMTNQESRRLMDDLEEDNETAGRKIEEFSAKVRQLEERLRGLLSSVENYTKQLAEKAEDVIDEIF